MKVIVSVPLKPDYEYLDDFDEETIPDVGDRFNEDYVVSEKIVRENACMLSVKRIMKG